MTKVKKSTAKKAVQRNTTYPTRRRLISATQTVTRVATANTMKVMSYAIAAH